MLLKIKLHHLDDSFGGFISLNQLIYFVRTQWKIKHVPRALIKKLVKRKFKTMERWKTY